MWCYLHGDPIEGERRSYEECCHCEYFRRFSGLHKCTYISPERKELNAAMDEVKKCEVAIRMRENRIRQVQKTRYVWRSEHMQNLRAEIYQWQLRKHEAEVALRRVQKKYDREKDDGRERNNQTDVRGRRLEGGADPSGVDLRRVHCDGSSVQHVFIGTDK